MNNYQKYKEKIKERTKKYYNSHKEHYSSYLKEYRKNNKEKLILLQKKWKEENADYQKEYFQNNKTIRTEKMSDYYVKNKEKIKEYQKQYREKNRISRPTKTKLLKTKEEKMSIRNKKSRERTKIDPNYRIRRNFQSRIKSALKGKVKKTLSTNFLLGCKIETARKHLEHQFLEGMTWNNHGLLWEIDHIRPCASFDLTEENNQKICFHYTNLQPLWKNENRTKRDKIFPKTYKNRYQIYMSLSFFDI